MKPGRELDALVAEKVMEWKNEPAFFGKTWDEAKSDYKPGIKPEDFPVADIVPHYSTDIAAAWELVSHIGFVWNGFQFGMFWNSDYVDGRNARWHAGWFEWGHGGPEGRASEISVTAPHAICLAALKSVGVEL